MTLISLQGDDVDVIMDKAAEGPGVAGVVPGASVELQPAAPPGKDEGGHEVAAWDKIVAWSHGDLFPYFVVVCGVTVAAALVAGVLLAGGAGSSSSSGANGHAVVGPCTGGVGCPVPPPPPPSPVRAVLTLDQGLSLIRPPFRHPDPALNPPPSRCPSLQHSWHRWVAPPPQLRDFFHSRRQYGSRHSHGTDRGAPC